MSLFILKKSNDSIKLRFGQETNFLGAIEIHLKWHIRMQYKFIATKNFIFMNKINV